MGLSIKINTITGDIAIEPPKLLGPSRNDFTSMINGNSTLPSYGSLLQSLLQRFPFVVEMPNFHPALKYNFQILKLIKGVTFRYKMKRIEEQFYDSYKKEAIIRDKIWSHVSRQDSC